jgi:glycerol transport system ATP-binding protein
MARIEIDNVQHAYAGTSDYALKRVNLVLEDGGAYALLGPSGCGKTTLINIISGLVAPSEGRIRFDGADVTALPTDRRNVAQVFQFPVVYDTMTVRQNLEFPLRNRGVAATDMKQQVDAVLEMTGLAPLADRQAKNLSPDLKQKVSLGRGLVRSDVAAILFDEPLTVIDPHLKWELRLQLKEMHARSRRTMIYVTHDQTEALTFAEKVIVLNNGEVVQVGTPSDLFERPEHTFVGYFIGSPGMNVFPATLSGNRARIGAHEIELAGAPATRAGARIEIGVRPEHVSLDPAGMPVTLERVEDIGRYRIAYARLDGHPFAMILQENEPVPADVRIRFDKARTHVYADGWRVAPSGGAA